MFAIRFGDGVICQDLGDAVWLSVVDTWSRAGA
jgi:hypothetical protein